MVFSILHPAKALCPIFVNPSLSMTDFNLGQFSNAESPIEYPRIVLGSLGGVAGGPT